MLSTSQLKPLGYLHVVVSPINNQPNSSSPPPSSSSSSCYYYSYPSAPSSTTVTMKKFKEALFNLLVTQLRIMRRAASEVRCKLVEQLKQMEFTDHLKHPLQTMMTWKKRMMRRWSKNPQPGRISRHGRQVKVCGSFRFHYNWAACSSSRVHVAPPPKEPALSRFNPALFHYGSIPSAGAGGAPEFSHCLSAYLYWLEENNLLGGDDGGEDDNCNNTGGINNRNNYNCSRSPAGEEKEDVDELAEKFISRCHEKFRLEKEESYRMFQEMMARSL